MGSGDCAGEHQDRLTIMTDSNQTPLLRSPQRGRSSSTGRELAADPAHDAEPNS
jgi:hypothetical protein